VRPAAAHQRFELPPRSSSVRWTTYFLFMARTSVGLLLTRVHVPFKPCTQTVAEH
jgi:hypothetical protein